ncbi:MAG: SDR family oxidoreductase [Clostridiaceae bacterium]
MKVLFIGGTGVISSAVSALAVEKGIELYLLNRGTRNNFVPKGAMILKGDIRDADSVAATVRPHRFDAVADWISFVPEHVENDIKLFSGITRQFIFISTASAYQRPVRHYMIDESTPLDNPFWQYSRDKIACEERLMKEYRENGFPVTIVRPSYTYNKTTIPFLFNSREHRWTIVDRMKKGKKIIVPGDGTSLFTVTHNSDFAKGFVGLVGNYQSIGHAFHITSDEVLTWDQIAHAIGAAAGVEPDIIHVSSDFICKVAPEYTGGLLGDKTVSIVFDNSKIKRFVPDFRATMPFSEGIRQSISWYESDPRLCTTDQGFNELSDRIIKGWEKGIEAAKLPAND